jgi:predicted metal-dependent phosphoesterase TrpH
LKKIDLHTHSTASDGSLSPTELVTKARSLGITTLALTDHDTFDGLDEALQAGLEQQVDVITGVEFSVDHEDGSLHLLGYGFDHQNARMQQVLVELVESRQRRNHGMIDILNRLGFRINFEDVLRRSGKGTMGRAHIALELIESGQFISVQEAFETVLGKGKPAYVDRKRLSLFDACDLIHQAGGVAVWAHPALHGNKLAGMLNRIGSWAAKGLDGIESDYSAHTIDQRNFFRQIAVTNRMIWTGGSDFHGEARPDVLLGTGPEGEAVGFECLETMKSRIARRRV